MALIDCKFFSETLGMCSSMRVILPETTERRIGSVGVSRAAGGASFRGHPRLWLLHGLSDDESIWSRLTSIERYVAPLGLSVVMPNVHRSFYTNMRSGYRYWDFVSQELLEKARGFFPLSSAREDNFVAGLSMGGYGALKLAFTLPEQFAAAASLSAAPRTICFSSPLRWPTLAVSSRGSTNAAEPKIRSTRRTRASATRSRTSASTTSTKKGWAITAGAIGTR
jgi:putative tributyrin esterase